MKRLVFLVEGDTELVFIKKHVMSYLYIKGFKNPMQVQKIVTNRKLQKKGGNVNFEYLKNDIERVLAQGNIIITTFLDFFRLPTSFPGYSSDVSKIDAIENSMFEAFGKNPFIVPYIQKHEMEALMFSGIDGFDIIVDDEKTLEKLKTIMDKYSNPEDINTNPDNAPSKRLKNIFNYDKINDGEMILEGLGIDIIISKCPRFKVWLGKIEDILKKY